MSEQLPLIDAPPGERKAPEPWKPPDTPEGAIAGYLTSRTKVTQYLDKVRMTPEAALTWMPSRGKFDHVFTMTLDDGSNIVEIPASARWARGMTLGDWVTVHKIREFKGARLATEIEIAKPAHHIHTLKLDAYTIGVQTDLLGQDGLAYGLDERDRRLAFVDGCLSKHFGRVKRYTKDIRLVPFDQLGGPGGIRSFYTMLGLTPPSNDEEVKNAYRQKSKETHPDLNQDDPTAAEKFMEVKLAFESLQTEKDRDLYDLALSMASNTFSKTAKKRRTTVKFGIWDGEWHPIITSGIVRGSGFAVGNLIVIDNITDITPVTEQGATRISAAPDGITELWWTEDL